MVEELDVDIHCCFVVKWTDGKENPQTIVNHKLRRMITGTGTLFLFNYFTISQYYIMGKGFTVWFHDELLEEKRKVI